MSDSVRAELDGRIVQEARALAGIQCWQPHPGLADTGRRATRWAGSAGDYAGLADGSSSWAMRRGELAAVEPATLRAGWLTAGRAAESGPDLPAE